jgi:regulatory protein
VTGLAEHPRRKGRIIVTVDGANAGLLTLDLVTELGLREGMELDWGARHALALAARRTAVLDKALDLLAVRARSSSELRQRLRRRDADATDIAWVLERLVAQGYIDDAQFARQYARTRIVGGGVSRRRLQDELYRRGVERETATEAIDDTLADVRLDEHSAALEAARKRLRSLGGLDAAVVRRRLYGFLARRGYEPDVVSRVLREVLDGRDEKGDAVADDMP